MQWDRNEYIWYLGNLANPLGNYYSLKMFYDKWVRATATG